MKIIDYFADKYKSLIWITALLLNIIIGTLDYLTSYEIRIEVFYLIPVSLISWRIGRNAGFLMSLLCILTTFFTNFLSGKVITNYFIDFWNAIVIFCFFIIVVYLVSDENIREQRFRRIFEDSPFGMILSNVDGSFSKVNSSFCNMLGYTKQEMLKLSYKDISHPDDLGKDIEHVQKVFLFKDYIYRTEKRYLKKDGEITWGALTLSSVRKPNNDFLSYIGAIEDINLRKKAEEERRSLEETLRRSEKMETLGKLAGGVAHDLNNILGVLVGYSELMLLEIPEDHPLRRHVNNIMLSGQRASAIIQDLLMLARRGVAISEIIDLNNIIDDYMKTPEFNAMKSYHPNVTFKTELEQTLLNIKGSPVHLGKVVMNLISNAVEAIDGHGEVRIKTENVYLDRPLSRYEEMATGEYILLQVSDTGRGIADKDIGFIFEPFYTKKVMGKSGTGLGLTIVWGTVKDHNGYIDVHSEGGKGTTFSLYFPITREQKAIAKEHISPETYTGKGESILVVDDVKEQRELAVLMLNGLGYKADAVAGGEEAIAYLKSKKVDLIVLDMIMDPGIDGLETYRRIIEINPGQKAIIVSGFSDNYRVKNTQKIGAGSFVRKPYILEKIGMAVRMELDRK